MNKIHRIRYIALSCCFFAAALSFNILSISNASNNSGLSDTPKFMEIAATPALLERLRSGGYVLYMRHGRTDPHKPDQVPIDLEDCATQRPLTDLGRAEIIMVGKALRTAGIPISSVLASPLCRAVESALLAFGPDFQVENMLMYTAHLVSKQKVPIIARTLELISTPVTEPEHNRILVSHAPNLADIMGYFPEREGTVIVFRPLGDGKYEYIASIRPEDWDGLLYGQ